MVSGGADLRRRDLRLWSITIAFSAATFVVVGLLALRDPGPRPPAIAHLPEFSLVDHRSAEITRETLRGRPFVASFFFTSCAASCPILTARMAALQDEIRAGSLQLSLLSISVDPETDTPARLAEHAARYSADEALWSFATGMSPELERTFVHGYEASCRKPDERGDANIYGVMHGDWFVLVDGAGWIRGFYDSGEPSQLRQLLADAERVARDPSLD